MKLEHQDQTRRRQRTVFYANGSFDNKGCEAIVRGAHKILSEGNIDIAMGTNAVSMDQAVADELDIRLARIPRSRESFLGTISEICRRIKLRKMCVAIPFVQLKRLGKSHDYSFSMGGDNYCYDGQERFYRMNRGIRNKNSKNFFWGCSE